MGVKFDKINQEKFSMTTEINIVNSNEGGTIYFVQHKLKGNNTSEIMDNQLGKKSHYAVAVDITGI